MSLTGILRFLLALSVTFSLALAQTVPVGAGLEGIADWSWSNAFVDLMKQSRGFGTPGAPWEASVAVDAAGWPTTDFGVILGVWDGMKNVGGTYRISGLCNSKPTIEMTASPGVIQNLRWSATTKTFKADLIYPEGGGQMMLTFRDTNGGIRKLKVVRPGYLPTDVFTAPFLQHLQRFSTLRFMDWTNTNGNLSKTWLDRTTPAWPSWAGTCTKGGVPWEVCADLCNTLHKDMWVNVPAMAGNAYVAKLAQLLRDRVDPTLHIYVEYSNEVWNWGFQQAQWNLQQARDEVAEGGSPLNYDGNTNEGVWAARRIVKRIKEISTQFKTVFGSSYASRVRPVLATQIAWPGHWLVEGLKFADEYYHGAGRFLYACAGAPYFNLGDANERDDLTVDDVLTAMNASIDTMKDDLNIEACATMTRYHNLKFVAYEGGPDTFGPHSIAAKKAASLDPRMQAICERYLKVWYGYGFDLFNWFVAGATNYDTQYGTWGLTNDMANQSSPKILAVDSLIAGGKPALTQGVPVPGPVDGRRWMFRDPAWSTQPIFELVPWDWRGPSRDYLVRSKVAGLYKIRLNASAGQAGAKVQILLNGVALGTVSVPVRTDGTYALTTAVSTTMDAGMQAMRIRLIGDIGCKVESIRFATP